MNKVKVEVLETLVYIEGIPWFRLLPNGEIDPIAPDAWTIYNNNKEEVDRILSLHPTLRGRLNQPLVTEKEAVEQLARIGGVELSERAKKILNENVV